MKTRVLLLLFICLTVLSCQKKEQPGLLAHQTVTFSVGPDFEIAMPDALPQTIRMISLSGLFQPISAGEEVALLLNHKGSEGFDTLFIKSACYIDNLDSDYFRYLDGKNVLKGNILVKTGSSWKECNAGELEFAGQLSFIYNAY